MKAQFRITTYKGTINRYYDFSILHPTPDGHFDSFRITLDKENSLAVGLLTIMSEEKIIPCIEFYQKEDEGFEGTVNDIKIIALEATMHKLIFDFKGESTDWI